MDILAQDPLLYWLLWAIATLIGVLLGWTLRAQWKEKALLSAYEQSEQERNSIAHLYSQLRTHHDQKNSGLAPHRIGNELAARKNGGLRTVLQQF